MSKQNFSVRHINARAMAADGVPVFPVSVNGKLPVTPRGFHDATTDLAQIDAWWSEADYNLAYRPVDLGCVVIDLDLYKSSDAGLLADLTQTYTVATPSGGEHRYYSTDETYGNSKLPGADVRCANGYVLGPGSVINGSEYRVVYDCEPAPLPAAIHTRLTTRESKPATGRELEGEEVDFHPGLWREAERILASYDFAGAEPTGDRAYIAVNRLLDLSADGKVMSAEFVAALLPWVAESVIENAIKHGQNERGERTVDHLVPSEGIPSEWVAAASAEPRKSKWRSPEEDAQLPPLEYFDSHKMFPRVPGGAVMIITGPKSSHKSGVAIKTGLDMIQAGYKILYVAAEGAHGIMTARLPAAKSARGVTWDTLRDSWHTWSAPFSLWSDCLTLISECQSENFKPDIIFLDTLTRCAPGDINSPQYGTDLHLAADRLARHFDALVVLIHHPKREGNESLGSTLIDALAYAVLHVSRQKNLVSVWVDKMKDGAAEFGVVFGVQKHAGVPVIVEAPAGSAKEIAPSSLRTAVLHLLEGSTAMREVKGMVASIEAMGFSEKTLMKACAGELSDLLAMHGDGKTFWEPLSFKPLAAQ